MKASLLNLDKINVTKKVAIIGDMLELGSSSQKEHSDMITYVKHFDFDQAIFVGKEFMKARDNNFGLYFSNTKTARNWFRKQTYTDAHILLKATRGVAIERLFK